MPAWAPVAVAMAVFRVAVALMLYVSGVAVPLGRPVAPLWVYAVLSATFTFAGLALVVSRRDARAAGLGAFLTMVGCPLVRPLIAGDGGKPLEWLESFHPEIFTPACLWAFAAAFPVDLRGRALRVVRGITAACAVLAAALVAISLASALESGSLFTLAAMLNQAPRDRVSPVWLLQTGLTAPALAFLVYRAIRAPLEARPRVRLFIAGLCVGLGPITLELLAEGIWPSYGRAMHRPATEPWITAVVFTGLGTLPFSMAYAVLFSRVVETSIALHAAAQYLLARYVVGMMTLIPFGGLCFYLVQHREDTLTSLFSGGWRPMMLLASALAGLAAARYRPRLLSALDRQYYREPYDGRRVLRTLTGPGGPATVAELGARVRDEIGNAFHARVVVFLMDDELTALQPIGQDLPPIPLFSPLLRAGVDGHATSLATVEGRQLLASLGSSERDWLQAQSLRTVTTVRSRVLGTVGLIAIGPRRSGLELTADDAEFLSSVTSALALAFDSLRLTRDHREPAMEAAGRECDGCGSVYGPESLQCRCGRPLSEAAAPYVLRGVFRFERRIGAGGAGVVYRARDLALGRTVAIKVLSGTRVDKVETLIREARHMAGVSHEHLATIHAVERWRQMPLLVQEYLEGGTLTQRLSTTPMTVPEVAALVDVLAGVLERVHAEGIVHCDVKPSNIGFTRNGIVKLFDFSLSRRVAIPIGEAPEALSPDAGGVDSLGVIAGTPYYMSPEAIRGEPPAPAFDWWSLSVVMFEALTGRRPFDGANTSDVLTSILFRPLPRLQAFRPDLPGELDRFFVRAFDRSPGGRTCGADEFRSLLAPVNALSAFHSEGRL